MQTLIAFFSGKKTYLLALIMIAHGIYNGDQQMICEGLLALFLRQGITKSGPQSPASTPNKSGTPPLNITSALFIMALIGVLVSFAVGCSSFCISNQRPDGMKTKVCTFGPAWPWQDSSKALDKLTVSARTNSFTAGVKGLEETETTSTNLTSAAERIAAGATRGAVEALTGKK